MNRVDGKVALVTGGGSGIGLACARMVVEGGGRVTLCGRRGEVLAQAASELGPRADYVSCGPMYTGTARFAVAPGATVPIATFTPEV